MIWPPQARTTSVIFNRIILYTVIEDSCAVVVRSSKWHRKTGFCQQKQRNQPVITRKPPISELHTLLNAPYWFNTKILVFVFAENRFCRTVRTSTSRNWIRSNRWSANWSKKYTCWNENCLPWDELWTTTFLGSRSVQDWLKENIF